MVEEEITQLELKETFDLHRIRVQNSLNAEIIFSEDIFLCFMNRAEKTCCGGDNWEQETLSGLQKVTTIQPCLLPVVVVV